MTFQFSTLAGVNVQIEKARLLPDGIETILIERRKLSGARTWALGDFLNISFIVYLSSFADPQAEFLRLYNYLGQRGFLILTGTNVPTEDSAGNPLRYQLINVTSTPLRSTSNFSIAILDFLCLEITGQQVQYILSDPDGTPILSDPDGTGIIADI